MVALKVVFIVTYYLCLYRDFKLTMLLSSTYISESSKIFIVTDSYFFSGESHLQFLRASLFARIDNPVCFSLKFA